MDSNTKLHLEQICFHCGDICENHDEVVEDKHFCCKGCKTVYQILNEKELCTYYNLDAHPGISPDLKNSDKYAYLDDTEIINQLLDFRNNNDARVTLLLPQMHCASCVWLLEKLYKINPGIKRSTVNYPKKQVSIQFDISVVSLREIVVLLGSIGYEPALSLADASERKETYSNKKLYFQIGIAGFCFGNIMLFSMPEYFDFTNDLTLSFKAYFGLINILFALPVLVYSDLDYFKSALGGLKQGIINLDVPLSLGMITLFTISLYEILNGKGPGYLDSFTGLVFFLLLGRAFQQKTFKMISFERDYKSYFPLYANIIKGESHTTIPLSKLKIGDRLLIKNNDLIPADGILLKGSAYIDYSFVTGESEPVFKELGEIIYAGGKHLGAHIEIEIIREVSNSYLTELWNNQAFKSDKEKDLKTLSNKIGKWFTISVLGIALITAIFWLPDYTKSIMTFSAVLIIACPCALALSIPYTFGNAIRILGKSGFYLKSAGVVEKIAQSDFIVFDKTGTLTDTNTFDIEYVGAGLDQNELQYVKSIVSLSSHPLSRSLNSFLKQEQLPVTNFREDTGLGISGTINGNEIKIGSGDYIGNGLSDGVHILIDNQYKGKFIIKSKLRKSSEILIPSLSRQYSMALCSGDTEKDALLFSKLLPEDSNLLFNQKPIDKLNYIKKLNNEKHKVIMIGDGLNDAGALKASEVGISITDNTGQFSPASDVIMDAEVFDKLDKILEFNKFSVQTVKISFALSGLYNLAGLVFAVQGLLTPVFAAILMPLSSVSVVLFATLMTNIQAKRLKLI